MLIIKRRRVRVRTVAKLSEMKTESKAKISKRSKKKTMIKSN